MKKAAVVILLAAVALGWYFYESPIPDFGRKVLVFSKTTEYRHQSIPKGIATLTELGRRGEYNVVATEDASVFTEEGLAAFHAIVFLNTTGDVLDDEQQEAMQRYIQAGGGYVGLHAAADTEWRQDPWYWYQRLVGGVFAGHPEDSDQRATLAVVQPVASITTSLPASFEASDEWYDYQRLSPGVNVLLTVDESTYEGGQMGADHPMAWYREFDGGRSFYTGLGHTESTYDNEHFQSLLLAGLEWAMGDGTLDYAKARPESWRFTRTVLDSNLNEPLKIMFSPGGDLYYVERRGAIKRYDFTAKSSVTVGEVPVFTSNESGLHGMVFDPDYANNGYVYIYYSPPRADQDAIGETVLSRFRLEGTLDLESEERMLSEASIGNSATRASHHGGDMQFDRAGNLWLSTGDDTAPADWGRIDDRPGQLHNDAARSAADTSDLRGKILRIRPLSERNAAGLLYEIPQGNLFSDPGEGRPEIYAMGLRNPFTIAYDDRTGYLYWGEVGPDGRQDVERGPKGYDEVNRTRVPGNFGWPYVIADGKPYHYYDHDNDTVLEAVNVAAPENRSRNNTGAKVLPPAQPAWLYYPYDVSETFFEMGSGGRNALVAPLYYAEDYADSEYKFPAWLDGKLVIGEFMRNWLQVVTTDAAGNIETIAPLIDHAFSSPLDMAFGPDGALYVVEYGSVWFEGNPDAYLSRIEYYAGDNPPPVAIASVDKAVGASPLVATLDGTASYDRGSSSGIVEYRWELNLDDGTVQQLGSAALQPVSIDKPGEHRVQLTVTDEGGLEHATSLMVVVGNERPEVSLAFNGNSSFYSSAHELSYRVSVNDLEDGTTDDGGIDPGLVNVRFDYLGESEDLAIVLAQHDTDPVLAGRALVTKGSDCHGCHQVDGPSVGPSLAAIAERYAARDDALVYIERSIAEGGSGKWPGGHAMPAHPALTAEELSASAKYILSLAGAAAAQDSALPIEGTLSFEKHLDDKRLAQIKSVIEVEIGEFYPGRYLLHAAYTDAGGDAPPLTGSASRVLYSPQQGGGFLAPGPGVTLFSVPENVTLAIIESAQGADFSFAYGAIESIDLTGIDRVVVGVAALAPIFGGGELQLRIDDPNGAPLGTAEIESSLLFNREDSEVVFDLSALEGLHTLYFGMPVTADGDGEKPPFAIVALSFEGPALSVP